jgi:hypothetical protein
MADGNAGRFADAAGAKLEIDPSESELRSRDHAEGLHPRLGRIVGLAADGRALVGFADAQPQPASTLGPVSHAELEQAAREQRVVVLGFLDGRADAPVLLSLHGPSESLAAPTPEPARSTPLALEVDGERRVIEASRELTLRCGEASITLRGDGSITIRGRDVTSSARRRQRIRGGSVSIN